ncbi:MAG: pyridoxal-phosphate dependent enzyme [Antricoccus sp.]
MAESIFEQLSREEHPDPEWIVVSPGTGGTSTTIGRFIRYHRHRTKLCVTDPEQSVFFQSWCANDRSPTGTASSRIEGIGRPRIEPSFLFDVVDRMMVIPDAGSIAAMRFMHEITRSRDDRTDARPGPTSMACCASRAKWQRTASQAASSF